MDTPTPEEGSQPAATERPASRLPRAAIFLVLLMVFGSIATAVLLMRYFGLNSG